MIDHPTVADVLAARARLAGHIRRTPMASSPSLSERTGADIRLKLEHHQITGSFKLRGATNAVACLTDRQRARGVAAVSAGNHGRGLAYACKRASMRCVVCMSELVPRNKIDGVRALGAEVRVAGRGQDEAEAEVNRLVAEAGMATLPPFDHPDVIAGQGTLGLEMMEECPEAETLVIALSGGGLISGAALAAKALNPKVRIIGVSMDRGPAMHASLKAGKPVAVEELPTLADALAGGIGLDNRHTFDLVRDLVDDVILLTEAEIAEAVRHAYWSEGEIVEGAGAMGVGAVLTGKLTCTGPTVLLLCGKNIDMTLHHRIVSGENVEAG